MTSLPCKFSLHISQHNAQPTSQLVCCQAVVQCQPVVKMEASFLLICLTLASFALLAQPAAAQFSYPARVIQADSCPSSEQSETTRADINGDLDTLLQDFVAPPLISCGGLGWRRIAYVNTTESNLCPSEWSLSTVSGKVLCQSRVDRQYSSITFNTGGIPYNQVCGRVTGFQFGQTEAFEERNMDIDSVYVDGVSITHGSPRQHIWSFAAGRAEITSVNFMNICPCSLNSTNNVPTFVGNNYFCDTGTISNNGQNVVYLDDPLWDGQGCGPSSTCCSLNSPPWFNVRLPNATTDNIEVRLGVSYFHVNENVLLELLVIYVQ